jgi:hypothetical protein
MLEKAGADLLHARPGGYRRFETGALVVERYLYPELPDDLKKAAEKAQNEANLRGHLKGEDEEDDTQEEGGSSSYVPPEKDKDIQLHYGLDLLRGIKSVDTDAKKKTEAN